jgi:alkylation response protein AidB-like acyl-CoA dehydrogenase
MNFLQQERTLLEEFLPTLDAKLEKIPLLEMESQGNPAIQIFRELGGAGLLIPRECGGLGVTPLQLVKIQRAIASRSPSLAVATTMHHSTVVALLESATDESVYGFLQMIAHQNLYLASAFAEGKTNTSVLSPNIEVERTSHGLVVTGSKKPCSLSASMDFLTASVLVPSQSGGEGELALVIIPANSPGIERRPFWNSWVLSGAESDEVILNQVLVPQECISYLGGSNNLGFARGLLWFELLVCASYLGAASALVERTILACKGSPTERVLLSMELEGAMAALESIAHLIAFGDTSEAALARTIFVRHTVQRAIERASMLAAELLGGMAFVKSNEVAYLLATSRALAFHPPSRLSIASALDQYLAGEPLILP